MRSILIYSTVFEWLYNSYLLDILVNGDTVHTSIRQQTTNTKVKKINIKKRSATIDVCLCSMSTSKSSFF